jgi:hypothetical protein
MLLVFCHPMRLPCLLGLLLPLRGAPELRRPAVPLLVLILRQMPVFFCLFGICQLIMLGCRALLLYAILHLLTIPMFLSPLRFASRRLIQLVEGPGLTTMTLPLLFIFRLLQLVKILCLATMLIPLIFTLRHQLKQPSLRLKAIGLACLSETNWLPSAVAKMGFPARDLSSEISPG